MSTSAPVLNHVTPMIPAGKNFKEALDFYEKKLGFTSTYKDDDMVIIQRGSVNIILQNYDDAHVASQTAFRIELSGVDALYSEYQAQGIQPFHIPEGAGLGKLQNTPWGTREFAVRDLAGVCITFFERQS